jgi:hypothetical protein
MDHGQRVIGVALASVELSSLPLTCARFLCACTHICSRAHVTTPQPMASVPRGTVLNGVMHHMLATGQCEAGDDAAAQGLLQGVAHRLDRDTSGVVLVSYRLTLTLTLNVELQTRRSD